MSARRATHNKIEMLEKMLAESNKALCAQMAYTASLQAEKEARIS